MIPKLLVACLFHRASAARCVPGNLQSTRRRFKQEWQTAISEDSDVEFAARGIGSGSGYRRNWESGAGFDEHGDVSRIGRDAHCRAA